MPTPPKQVAQGPMSRAEKMSILSAMLGPDAMARLREGQTEGPAEFRTPPVAVDAERAAWQRNKLLERLRHHGGARIPSRTVEPDQQNLRGGKLPQVGTQTQRASGPENAHLDARLAKISDLATLGQEHPAIIARLVKSLSRDERVEALKALPGPVARSIVRRLR